MLPFPIYFLHMEFARQSCPIRRIDSSTFRCNLSSRPSFQSSLGLLRFFQLGFEDSPRGIRRFLLTEGSIYRRNYSLEPSRDIQGPGSSKSFEMILRNGCSWKTIEMIEIVPVIDLSVILFVAFVIFIRRK